MRGLGTIVNTAAIVVGGLVGILFKKGLSERFRAILTKACGVATIFIGCSGALSEMLTVSEDGTLGTRGLMLLVISMVLGGLAGEALNIEAGLERLGDRLKKRLPVREDGDGSFSEGFVNASLIVCVGAMAIIGSIQDGLYGDCTTLLTKSVLDFITVMVMASVCGVGSVFSAIPLFVYQGLLTLVGMLVGPVISDALIADLNMVGSVLIFCIGINLAFGNRLKTGNYLPALLVPVFYELYKIIF